MNYTDYFKSRGDVLPDTIKILLIEDNPGDVRLVQEVLAEARGITFELEYTDRLSVGLEYLTAGDIDVVLLDLSLPDSQGLETIERVHFHNLTIPIVVLTGYDDESFAITAVRSGAQDFLVKGDFSSLLLVRVIRHAIERKRAELKLQEAQKSIRNIINSSLDMIIAVDAGRRITEFNSAAESTLGYRREEIIGKHSSILFADAHEDLAIQGDLKQSGRFTGEVTNRRKDGTTFPSFISSSSMHDDLGNVIGYMGVSRDITEQKRAEEELNQAKDAAETLNRELMASNNLLAAAIENARKMAEIADLANRAKSDFLANMSHEIRTPMNAILGMSELLSERTLGDEEQEFVRIIRTAGESLLDLINDILDLSKIEAGQLDLELVDFDLTGITGGVVDMFSKKARDKGLELHRSIAADEPVYVNGDPVRLRQILINLMGNAIKFTSTGKVEVRVSVDGSIDVSDYGDGNASDDERVRLLFEVIDTGIGIPPEKQETIFDSFSQADSSTTRQFGGTGLGLTISKRLVYMMDGDISVSSQPGRGSTFSFTACCGIREKPPEVAPGRKAAAALVPSPGDEVTPLSILLVEDSIDNRKLIQFYLKQTTHSVDVAENGEIAVEKFTAGRYDLVLMDMQMPVMDGYTATRNIRQWEDTSGAPRTPIVALTASALEGDREKSLAAGCDDHLTKPIKKKMLLQAVNGIAQGTQTAEKGSDEVVEKNSSPAVPIEVTIDADIEDLIEMYFSNRYKDIDLMYESLETGDYETIRITGHSMKGSGASYGFDAITDIGHIIEVAAKEKNDRQIRQSVLDLKSYLGRVKVVFE